MTAQQGNRRVTANQASYITSLVNERVVPDGLLYDNDVDATLERSTMREASALIDALRALPRRAARVPVQLQLERDRRADPIEAAREAADMAHLGVDVREPVTEPGMYSLGEEIFRVRRSRGSQRLYATKLVVIGGRRLIDDDEAVVNFEFEYARGAIYQLSASDRMSLEEAKAFGIRYGVCCVCGIHLKDATSVALGIGPVCGGRV